MFAKAREKARQSSCSSNLKQLGIAMMQYVQDYDETYMRVYADSTPYVAANRIIWAQQLVPYIKNDQVFSCPSAHPVVSGNMQQTRYQAPMTHVFGEGGAAPVNLTDFAAPSETLIITESSNAWYQHLCPRHAINNAGGLYVTTNGQRALWGTLGETTYPWHNEGCNNAFGDGHVKWLSITAMGDASARYLWDKN